MPNFTHKFLSTLQANGKIQDVKDDHAQGLYIRVSPKGARTFYLVRCVRYKTIRVKIGRYPALTIEQARHECEGLNRQIELGITPNTKTLKEYNETLTLDELFYHYLENHIRPHNKNEKYAVYSYGRYLQAFHKKQLSEITKLKVLELQRNLAKDSEKNANTMIVLLKALFNRAIDWDIWTAKNPVQGIQKFREVPRDRYLKREEESRFFTALDKTDNLMMKAFFYLLFYTGARRGELQTMKWSDIHTKDGVTTWEYTQNKTKKFKITPIIEPANLLLEQLRPLSKNQYVFYSPASQRGYLQSPQNAWRRLLKQAEITENLRIHDIRHTVATWLSQERVNHYMIEQHLGHAKNTITATYISHDVAAHLEAINTIFEKLEKRLKQSSLA